MSTAHPITFDKFPNLFEIESAYAGLKALFFDMDGTLFNTEKYHDLAMQKIGITYKIRPPISPDEVHELLVGRADHLVFDIVKTWENFPKDWTVTDFVNSKNEFFLEIIKDVNGSEYFAPELKNLILEAKAKGFKIALVTSSEKPVVTALLNLTGLSTFFDLILTRDDCPKHKPDPWPYVEALRVLNLSPKEAIIFEDSNVGLAAANASGAHTVKVIWY